MLSGTEVLNLTPEGLEIVRLGPRIALRRPGFGAAPLPRRWARNA